MSDETLYRTRGTSTPAKIHNNPDCHGIKPGVTIQAFPATERKVLFPHASDCKRCLGESKSNEGSYGTPLAVKLRRIGEGCDPETGVAD